MASDETYFQCRLARGTERTTGWLEARGARQGLRVQLLDMDRPGELWEVVEVYAAPLSKSQLTAKQLRDRNALPSIVGITR